MVSLPEMANSNDRDPPLQELVVSFLKSYKMGVADRLFRTLAPEYPAKLD